MKVLVICPHLAPDTAPTGLIITAIVDQLGQAGHQVRVVTALPWYQEHRVAPQWRGRMMRTSTEQPHTTLATPSGDQHHPNATQATEPAGRKPTGAGELDETGSHPSAAPAARSVVRVYPFPTSKRSIAARAAGFAGFTALSTLAALKPGFRPDVVLAMSPPLTLGLAGWVAARLRRAPLVFNVQDVFPDAAIEVGALRGKRLIALARALERLVYRGSDVVTVLSDDMARNVSAKIKPRDATEVRVIPNFTDTSLIRPRSRHTDYRAEHDLGERTVVMYAGNVGLSQPLELMLEAARALRDRDDVVFVVNGSGSARTDLEAQAARDRLHNLRFVDFQPEARLGEVLASADIHVIALRRGLARASVPSKLYSVLAAGRAVVASVDEQSEVARTVRAAQCGIWVPPDDPHAFVAAVRDLIEGPEEAAQMGLRGREYAEAHVSPEAVGDAYAELFGELLGER